MLPFLTLVAAQLDDQTINRIQEIHARLALLPHRGFRLILGLCIFIAIAVVLVWNRQRTIARNQVDTARLLQELLDRKK